MYSTQPVDWVNVGQFFVYPQCRIVQISTKAYDAHELGALSEIWVEVQFESRRYRLFAQRRTVF
jgi:hypothetical protein